MRVSVPSWSDSHSVAHYLSVKLLLSRVWSPSHVEFPPQCIYSISVLFECSSSVSVALLVDSVTDRSVHFTRFRLQCEGVMLPSRTLLNDPVILHRSYADDRLHRPDCTEKILLGEAVQPAGEFAHPAANAMVIHGGIVHLTSHRSMAKPIYQSFCAAGSSAQELSILYFKEACQSASIYHSTTLIFSTPCPRSARLGEESHTTFRIPIETPHGDACLDPYSSSRTRIATSTTASANAWR